MPELSRRLLCCCVADRVGWGVKTFFGVHTMAAVTVMFPFWRFCGSWRNWCCGHVCCLLCVRWSQWCKPRSPKGKDIAGFMVMKRMMFGVPLKSPQIITHHRKRACRVALAVHSSSFQQSIRVKHLEDLSEASGDDLADLRDQKDPERT